MQAQDITAALRRLGVQSADTLFVHADVGRYLGPGERDGDARLASVAQGLADTVADGTLVVPTFTYSFCRREVFDLATTPSTVGPLSEHFRGRDGVRRTCDPIFSAAVLGEVPAEWEPRLFEVGNKDCLGEHSVFAYLLEADARLVFLGVDPSTACTLVHHVEQRQLVDYRYFKDFRGVVAAGSELALVTARYFVRELDGDVETFLVPLVQALQSGEHIAQTTVEPGVSLGVVSARAVAEAAEAGLAANPHYLLERGHPELAHMRYA